MRVYGQGIPGRVWQFAVQTVWQKILLESVFGSDDDAWDRAFATAHVKEGRLSEMNVLVLTAQHELAGLQTQADEFVDELEAVGCWVQQLCVPGTNHGTIMSGISNPVDAKCKHPVVEALSKFILTTVVDRKMCML
eukprot:TRINITY_DN3480_c0_g1_i1.p1 TRINITY_DN3480_c0_g1~~TRINITY_DN3480_c0_g1_i1.p1  ORF type:complete len:136 (-),score=16.57 TRINITY_DN3480_c0_g1_i1:274-681(-)